MNPSIDISPPTSTPHLLLYLSVYPPTQPSSIYLSLYPPTYHLSLYVDLYACPSIYICSCLCLLFTFFPPDFVPVSLYLVIL